MTRFVLTLCALLLAVPALAANRFPVQAVAFSRSGAHVMVLSGGEQDGSGFPVAQLEVRHTGTGAVVWQDEARRQAGSGAGLARQLLAGRQPQLQALGFRGSGAVPGRLAQPVYRRTFAPQVTWAEATPAGRSVVTPVKLWSRAVPVRLDVKATPNRCAYAGLLPAGDRPAAFTLTVNGRPVAAGAGDRCTTRYALESVFVQGNRAAFLLRAYTVGFEGPDATLRVVAVTLH